ncbi:glutathione S-transferase family protein [Paraglaciecola sp.]|uniref:glutathione S-transferase family protein n=1 Tax=Paraglaciecola sp. TaxID=1920173 RepID=UPI003EF6D414
MYTLYSMSGSCSSAIHMLLIKHKIPVQIVFHKDVENFHEISPTGQVPALKTPDGLLTEGAAICQYLFEKHQISVSSQSLQFNQQLMFNYATLHPAYSKMFTAHFAMPSSEAKDEFMNILAFKAAELWKIIDTRLEGQKFITGDEVCVLDYLIAIYASWGNVFPYAHINLGENVVRLIDDVSKLPEFEAVTLREEMQFAIPAAA